MSQMVLPCHTNQRGELSVGQLLKWIDTTACLSAERHAGCPCVTASMDDIYFEHTISVGQVVNIKAKVNRAFNSSMEVGIQVASEDLCSEKQWSVCKALATFVAHRELSRVKLKQTTPQTEEEKMEHSVAAERRRMRLLYADTIKDLLANCAIQDGEWPWVRRAADIPHAPVCPRPPLGSRGRTLPRTGLMALLPQGLLPGRACLASCSAPGSCDDGIRT